MEEAQEKAEEGTAVSCKRGMRLPIMLSHEEYFRLKDAQRKAGFKTMAQYARSKLFEDADAKYGRYLKQIEAWKAFQASMLA